MKQKHGFIILIWSDKAFKGTAVNRALQSLHGGSLELTHSFPVRGFENRFSRVIAYFTEYPTTYPPTLFTCSYQK